MARFQLATWPGKPASRAGFLYRSRLAFWLGCGEEKNDILYNKTRPEEEQELLATPEDINAWNARKMDDRPFYQRPDQSVSWWQASCEAIYALTLRMNDADLERPFWMPLIQGWITARDGLEFCRDHDWRAFGQLQFHMQRTEPVVAQAVSGALPGKLDKALQLSDS